MSLSTSLTSDWKTAGALVNPNGMTRYSQCLVGVLNAVFQFIPISDVDQVVGVSEVKLGEDGRALQKLKGGSHQMEGGTGS